LIGAYGSHIGADGAAIRLRQGYGGQVAVNAEKEERAGKSFSSKIFTNFAYFCCSLFSSQIVDFSPLSEPQELAG
jgi:hypothetical protein